MPKTPTKGELNTDYGFYVERPFFVISELPKHKYMDRVNNNMILKTQNGFDSQKWFFDQKTKTIMSVMKAVGESGSKSMD